MAIFDAINNLAEVVNNATAVHYRTVGQKRLNYPYSRSTTYKATHIFYFLQEVVFHFLTKLIADVFSNLS